MKILELVNKVNIAITNEEAEVLDLIKEYNSIPLAE